MGVGFSDYGDLPGADLCSIGDLSTSDLCTFHVLGLGGSRVL